MKINEVMARDKTRKDHNGNFLGFDPERKVWVVVPRDVGKGMISRGELANGALMVTTRYPEFSPSAAPKPEQPSGALGASFGAYAKSQLGQLTPKSIAANISNKANQAGINAIEKLKKAPGAVGAWLDRDERKQRSRGGDFTG